MLRRGPANMSWHCQMHRRHIGDFSNTSSPLTELLQRHAKRHRSCACAKAFHASKNAWRLNRFFRSSTFRSRALSTATHLLGASNQFPSNLVLNIVMLIVRGNTSNAYKILPRLSLSALMLDAVDRWHH